MENQESNNKTIEYNLFQLLLSQSRHKMVSGIIGRGGGKSTAFGIRLKDYNYQLPRAKIAIPGDTYKQLLTRTLPSTIEGLEFHGLIKDKHFVVGTRPPKSWKWPEAYQPPLVYETSISFYTGFTAQLVSLDSDTGGRGINFDGVIGDEAGTLNIERLSNNVFAANRGNIDRFKGHWLHHAVLLLGSMPLAKRGKWFIQLSELAKKEPDKYLHIIASSYINAKNLGADFFKTCQQMMTTLQYNAEILSIIPGQIENGFYPCFSEKKHTYDASNENYLFGLNGDINLLKKDDCRMDSDLIDNLPIDISCDWGARINCLECGQPSPLSNEYRLINSFEVLSPLTLHDLATKFCDYYEAKTLKHVNFYYDHTAMYKDAARTTTFADEMSSCLIKRGWTVNRIYVGQAPKHATKFLFFSIAHREDGTTNLPALRYNKNNCEKLIISIEQAGAVEGSEGTEKDKRPERKEKQDQTEATHHSDAHDTLIYFKFRSRLNTSGYIL